MAILSSTLRHVRDWGECALSLAFPWPETTASEPVRIKPPLCQRCGYPFPALENHQHAFSCSQCADRVWHFLWARAAYRTEGQIHEAIVGFKYRDEYYQHGRLVDWLTEAYDRYAIEGKVHWDALVPVPLYHRRQRERGFNQARELADGLGAKRKIRQ